VIRRWFALSCLEDDAEGVELEVLWEKEVEAQRVTEADWSRLAQGHFDELRRFRPQVAGGTKVSSRTCPRA